MKMNIEQQQQKWCTSHKYTDKTIIVKENGTMVQTNKLINSDQPHNQSCSSKFARVLPLYQQQIDVEDKYWNDIRTTDQVIMLRYQQYQTTPNVMHTSSFRTSPNALMWMEVVQVLQCNIAIEGLTWTLSGYRSYIYEYVVHTNINKYETACNLSRNVSIQSVHWTDWHQYYCILLLASQYICTWFISLYSNSQFSTSILRFVRYTIVSKNPHNIHKAWEGSIM